MTNTLSTKEKAHHAAVGILKEAKNEIYISVVSSDEILVSSENVTLEEHKTKNRLKDSYM